MFDLLFFFAEEWFKQYETVESLKTVDTLLGEELESGKNPKTEGSFGSWKEPLERHFLETGGSENTSKIFYEVGKRKHIKKILKRDWTKSKDYIKAIFLLATYSSNQE